MHFRLGAKMAQSEEITAVRLQNQRYVVGLKSSDDVLRPYKTHGGLKNRHPRTTAST